MHVMTVDQIIHYDKDKNVLWKCENLPNKFHTQGQEFILKSIFKGLTIPTNYYLGLDNRSTVNQADTLANLVNEPTTNGYIRQTINSQNGFNTTFDLSNWKVKTSTITFMATGGNWGPVSKAFLTTGSGNQGFLISTVSLPTTKTVNNGEIFTFKFSLALTE